MRAMIARLAADRAGSNALEYGLIVALVSLAVVTGAAAVGTSFDSLYASVGERFVSITAYISSR
jgi:Flp pilus assembly pilin Flp